MLPLKLSQTNDGRRSSSGSGIGSGIGSSGSTGGYQRLSSSNSPPGDQPSHSHSRTGSSPAAMMQNSPPGSPVPPKVGTPRSSYPKQSDNQDEKVIFFWQLVNMLPLLWVKTADKRQEWSVFGNIRGFVWKHVKYDRSEKTDWPIVSSTNLKTF